jgi:hypothetical protein
LRANGVGAKRHHRVQLLEDFGVPRLDLVVCEAVLFAQYVDADSIETAPWRKPPRKLS